MPRGLLSGRGATVADVGGGGMLLRKTRVPKRRWEKKRDFLPTSGASYVKGSHGARRVSKGPGTLHPKRERVRGEERAPRMFVKKSLI